MFEHMSDAGFATGIVYRADVHVSVKRDHGRLMAFEDDEVQSVSKGEFGDALFEVF